MAGKSNLFECQNSCLLVLAMARRGPGRPRRCASVGRLVEKTVKEDKDEEKAKKLGSKKEQQWEQQESNHIDPVATNVSTAGKPSM